MESQRNIEIKARIQNVDVFMSRFNELIEKNPNEVSLVIIKQEDYFFNCKFGRLKLRFIQDGDAELIQYERPDVPTPKLSAFSICKVADGQGLLNVLSKSLGILGVVRKTRQFFIVDSTRIHVDNVEGLGHFMELEVMLKPEETITDGQTKAERFMDILGVVKENLQSAAYVDLLLNKDTNY